MIFVVDVHNPKHPHQHLQISVNAPDEALARRVATGFLAQHYHWPRRDLKAQVVAGEPFLGALTRSV